jgi:uncharacterized protein YjiS (DUF1127 family)
MTQLVLTASNFLNISGIMEWFSDMYRAYRKGAERRALRRETLRELRSLTNHELRDLGIGRSDIMSIANGTFYEEKVLNDVKTNNNLKGWV